jgi:hypothetical protein
MTIINYKKILQNNNIVNLICFIILIFPIFIKTILTGKIDGDCAYDIGRYPGINSIEGYIHMIHGILYMNLFNIFKKTPHSENLSIFLIICYPYYNMLKRLYFFNHLFNCSEFYKNQADYIIGIFYGGAINMLFNLFNKKEEINMDETKSKIKIYLCLLNSIISTLLLYK